MLTPRAMLSDWLLLELGIEVEVEEVVDEVVGVTDALEVGYPGGYCVLVEMPFDLV
jgi:hypothetical protein